MTRFLISFLVLLLAATTLYADEFYVSTTGVDSTDRGTSEDLPFRTINYALSVADTTEGNNTIYIASGTYGYPEEIFPLPLIENIALIGEDPENTIIDVSGTQSNCFTAVWVDNWSIENLTLTNGRSVLGGGLSMLNCNMVTLHNLIVTNNRGDHPFIPDFEGRGGGIAVTECSDITLDHILLTENSARDNGGAIYIDDSDVLMTHCTITENSCDLNENSSAIYQEGAFNDEVLLKNSIVWANGNIDGDIYTIENDNIDIAYSLVENENSIPWAGPGNVWNDPLFSLPGEDFTLIGGSWAVDIADPADAYENEPAPNGSRANAGFYGNTEFARISASTIRFGLNRWYFVGLPVDAGTTNPQEIFGPAMQNSVPGEGTWHLQQWSNEENTFLLFDELEENGQELGDPNPVEPGQGYFIRQNMLPMVNLAVEGNALTSNEDVLVNLPGGTGWRYHMVANPFPYPINLQDTRLVTNSGELTFEQALDEGIASLYAYEAGGRGIALQPTRGVLNRWQGVVLKTNSTSDIQWLVHPQRNRPVNPGISSLVDWVLTMDVLAINSDDEAVDNRQNIAFGTLDGFSTAVDEYDAEIIEWAAGDFDVRWLHDDHADLYYDFRASIPENEYEGWRMGITYKLRPNSDIEEVPEYFDLILKGFREGSEEDPAYPDSLLNFWLANSSGQIIDEFDRLESAPVIRTEAVQISDSVFSTEVIVFVGNNIVSGVKENTILPEVFELESVYPNPFNSTVNVQFILSQVNDVSLRIYDILGREVDSIVWSQLQAGSHQRAWEAKNQASGIYFMELSSGDAKIIQKVMLVK